MLVSVNISAYNEQDYLSEIFDSLTKQTYPLKNIEVVLVNAMSKRKIIFQKHYILLKNLHLEAVLLTTEKGIPVVTLILFFKECIIVM